MTDLVKVVGKYRTVVREPKFNPGKMDFGSSFQVFNLGLHYQFDHNWQWKPDGLKVFITYTSHPTPEYVVVLILSIPFDLQTAKRSGETITIPPTATGQMQNILFNGDGTVIYWYENGKGFWKYFLSTAYDISTAGTPTGPFIPDFDDRIASFSDDGLTLFASSFSGKIYKYSLSTAFDLTDVDVHPVIASMPILPSEFASADFPYGMKWKDDGTKLYIGHFQDETIYQYSASVAYDVTTLTYDSKSLDVSAEGTSDTYGIFWKDDGTSIYVVRDYTVIFQYDLTTAWDLSTASYASKNVDVGASVDPDSYSFWIRSNGLKLYTVSDFFGDIFQWTLSTAWDISTATYDTVTFRLSDNAELPDTIGNNGFGPAGIYFNTAGTKMFIADYSDNGIHRYRLNTPWDISTLVWEQFSDNIPKGHFSEILSNSDEDEFNLTFDLDDQRFFAMEMSTALDLDSIPTITDIFSPVGNNFRQITISPDGKAFFLSRLKIFTEYSMAVALDISNATLVAEQKISVGSNNSFKSFQWFDNGFKAWIKGLPGWFLMKTLVAYSVADLYPPHIGIETEDNTIGDISVRADGKKLYMSGSTTDIIYEYDLLESWKIGSLVYTGRSFDPAETATLAEIHLSSDGLKLYLNGGAEDNIFEYDLTIAWDISTAVYSTNFGDYSAQLTGTSLFNMKEDGTKVWIGDGVTIFQYSLTIPFDISSLSFDSKSLDCSQIGVAVLDMQWVEDGNAIWIFQASGVEKTERFSASTPYDISTVDLSRYFDVTPQATTGIDVPIVAKPDGTIFWISAVDTNLHAYNMSKAGDPTTAVFDASFNTVNRFKAMQFADNGNKFYGMKQLTPEIIEEYTMTIPYDISTLSLVAGDFDPVALGIIAIYFAIKTDGTKLYVFQGTATNTVEVKQYSLSPAYDISTATSDGIAFDLSEYVRQNAGGNANPTTIRFSDDGKRLLLHYGENLQNFIGEFSMNPPWDISTLTWVRTGRFGTSTLFHDFELVNDERLKKNTLLMSSTDSDSVFAMKLDIPNDINSANIGNIYNDRHQDTSQKKFALKPDGKRFFMTGQIKDTIFEYENKIIPSHEIISTQETA